MSTKHTPGPAAKTPEGIEGQLDACFVIMPYSWPKIPSPAAGLLRAILEREGLRARTLYGNITFWDVIGSDHFDLVSRNLETLHGVGSWTFSHIAFPDFHPDQEGFLVEAYKLCDPDREYSTEKFEEILFYVRECAERLVDDMVEHIIATGARMVGCSVPFQSQHVSSLALLRRLRDAAPDIATIMGGSNCESIMGLTTHKHFTWVDYVVSGEADDLIIPLARQILETHNDIPADKLPDAVFAPVHRRIGYPLDSGNGADGIPRATVQSLETAPVPNYDDFFDAFYASTVVRQKLTPGLAYESSRGCWWGKCTFCGLCGCGTTYRSKSARKILHDMDVLSRRYKLNKIETMDNILDMDHFTSLLPELARAGAPYSLFYETKSSLTRQQFEMLDKSGVRWIQPGIESLHSEVLKVMKKGTKGYQNIEILKWSRQYGVRMQWAIIFDFPREMDLWYEEMGEFLPLLSHLNPPFGFIPIRYHRFSHYEQNAEKYGLKLLVPEAIKHVFPLEMKDLRDLVYDFTEEHRENVKNSPVLAAIFDRPGITSITKAVIRWIRAFWSDEGPPMLGMTVTDDDVSIRDTRAVAVNPSYRLAGIEREVYLACEEAIRPEDLYEAVAANGAARDDIDAWVQGFLDNKLMLRIDGRLLGLAVREPCKPLLQDEEFPGGAAIGEFRICGKEMVNPPEVPAHAAEDRS